MITDGEAARSTAASPIVSPRPVSGPGGFGLVEVLVAAFAIIVLSAVVAPTLFRWIDDSKVARAFGDAGALAAAMTRFFQDTNRWPGQVEILRDGKRFLIVGDPATAVFPDNPVGAGIADVQCSGGLSGVSAETGFDAAQPTADNALNLMDFLLAPPLAADYPNWRGPYLPVDLSSDPWDRAWIINVIPLFCAETVTASAPGGAAGFGWILSGGPNRTLQTPLVSRTLDPSGDDVGVNLSKR